MTRLLAIAASTRAQSLNRRLLQVAVAEAEAAGAQVTTLDYAACASPLYQGEDTRTLPPGAAQVRDAMLAHEGLLLASPEHNWSIPAALKNLLDWLSVDPATPLRGRRALLMCASPSVRGGILGLQQLSVPLSHLGVHVYPHLIAMGDAEAQLAENAPSHSKDRTFLRHCVQDFVRTTRGC